MRGRCGGNSSDQNVANEDDDEEGDDEVDDVKSPYIEDQEIKLSTFLFLTKTDLSPQGKPHTEPSSRGQTAQECLTSSCLL